MWYGGNKEHIVITKMAKHMDYVWSFKYCVLAKTSQVFWTFNVRPWTTYLFWFRNKGTYSVPNKTVVDTYVSNAKKSGSFKWQKNLGVIAYYLCAFTKEGDLVLDTMAGEGSVGVVCKQFRRNYLGMEIDAKRAETAQKRIDNTQEMAILVEPTQAEMFDSAKMEKWETA